MDNLTHGLVGAALARTGLDRSTPLATTTLVVAANAPDVDMLAFVHGEYAALAFRRGLTHALPAVAILPLLVTAAILTWDRQVRRRRNPAAAPVRPEAVLVLSLLGLLTHPALDWLNTYGLRWWVPFDGSWSYGDALFIIDPWLWLGLGGAVALTGGRTRAAALGWGALAAASTALVSWAPIPVAARVIWVLGLGVLVVMWWARRHDRPAQSPAARWDRDSGASATRDGARARARGACRRLVVARSTVLAAASYVGLMVVADRGARADILRAAAAAGLPPVEAVMAAPLPADPFGTEVVVRTAAGYLGGSHRWLRTPRVVLRTDSIRPTLRWGGGVDSARAAAALEAAWRAPAAADFGVWTRFPRTRVDTASGGYRVWIADLRYAGRGGGSLEGVTVWLDTELAVLRSEAP